MRGSECTQYVHFHILTCVFLHTHQKVTNLLTLFWRSKGRHTKCALLNIMAYIILLDTKNTLQEHQSYPNSIIITGNALWFMKLLLFLNLSYFVENWISWNFSSFSRMCDICHMNVTHMDFEIYLRFFLFFVAFLIMYGCKNCTTNHMVAYRWKLINYVHDNDHQFD